MLRNVFWIDLQVFKNTACMMHMGNMTKDFVPVGKEEQAEIKDESNAEKVANLLGIDMEWMITYFCKPKLKVGTEWVNKGSTCNNAANSVAGIARAIYERTFRITVSFRNDQHFLWLTSFFIIGFLFFLVQFVFYVRWTSVTRPCVTPP